MIRRPKQVQPEVTNEVIVPKNNTNKKKSKTTSSNNKSNVSNNITNNTENNNIVNNSSDTPIVRPNLSADNNITNKSSDTTNVRLSTTAKTKTLTAYAFTDKQRKHGFRVLFGDVDNELCLNAKFELDDNFVIRGLTQPISLEIAKLFKERTYIATNTYTDVFPGKHLRPQFAINARAKLTGARPVRDVQDQNVDAGDLADTSAVLSASIDPDEVLKNFNGSLNQPPTAARITGAQLASLLTLPEIENEHRSELINRALVTSTMQEHNRMLRQLANMPDHLLQLPLPIAIPIMLWAQYIDLCWAPTTLFKYMCTAQGALRLLPIYRQQAPSIQLSNDTHWMMALKGARHMAVEHIPNQPKAATINAINIALNSTSGCFRSHTRIVIMLAWLTASRLGCIRKLRAEDVTFNLETKSMHINFRRGKGVRARQQAYTVTTLIATDAWWQEITEYINDRQGGYLFPQSLTDSIITKPLKAAGIEQRSIRRGSLQTMALIPAVTDEILMNFSGHASPKTLHRYLDFGRKSQRLATSSLSAATTLWKSDLFTDEWWDIGHDDRRSSSS